MELLSTTSVVIVVEVSRWVEVGVAVCCAGTIDDDFLGMKLT